MNNRGTSESNQLEETVKTGEDRPVKIQIENLSLSFGGVKALNDISVNIRDDEILAIIGPNGGGKTPLLKLLRGLLKPPAGEVWAAPLNGQPIRIGFVFQNPDYQLFAEQVWEEVAFGPRNLGLDPEEVNLRVQTALKRVHLWERAQDDPFSLTKGQRQRLAVAAVLALAPQVIILDEPTTGLDHHEQQDLLDLTAELNAQGHTIIMVTHTMWAAATYARRLIILRDGRVVLDGPADKLRDNEDVKEFYLGLSEVGQRKSYREVKHYKRRKRWL